MLEPLLEEEGGKACDGAGGRTFAGAHEDRGRVDDLNITAGPDAGSIVGAEEESVELDWPPTDCTPPSPLETSTNVDVEASVCTP